MLEQVEARRAYKCHRSHPGREERTGKNPGTQGLIAQAIHSTSSRRERPFIKLNCAAIPLDLLESELFGHGERASFTGAIAQKIGRCSSWLTKAPYSWMKWVIFRWHCSPNCCAYCREQEFERLGSARTHHVDVRLVGRDKP